jgi:hypothetical protein
MQVPLSAYMRLWPVAWHLAQTVWVLLAGLQRCQRTLPGTHAVHGVHWRLLLASSRKLFCASASQIPGAHCTTGLQMAFRKAMQDAFGAMYWLGSPHSNCAVAGSLGVL